VTPPRDPELAALRSQPGYESAWDDPEPLVTVRVATFDNAQVLVERTLASVRAQTYEHWEAVVVGDHCTDDTAERIAALGDERIRFINLPQRGPYPEEPAARWLVAGSYPMNRALEEARGDWIAPLDHDDAWDPDHLEVLLAEARRTHAELVYGQARAVDESSGEPLDWVIGQWPPEQGRIALQAAIHHGALAGFRYDPESWRLGEPGDWNVVRRMLAAGVRATLLEREVVTYWFEPRSAQTEAWLEELRGRQRADGSPSS
jgi:glycosyltransferase involved in cell wall biosynthesis